MRLIRAPNVPNKILAQEAELTEARMLALEADDGEVADHVDVEGIGFEKGEFAVENRWVQTMEDPTIKLFTWMK